MATNEAFIDAVAGLSVKGVKRKQTAPPNAVNTADLPMSYPLLPQGERAEAITSCVAGSKRRRMGFQILLEPVAQNTNAVNYGLLGEMMDNLETKIDALTVCNFIEYTVQAEIVPFGTAEFWAITADILGSEDRL